MKRMSYVLMVFCVVVGLDAFAKADRPNIVWLVS